MAVIEPSLEEFEKIRKSGKSQFVWSWIPADLETPVSAFLKLAKDKPYSFLLESVEGGNTLGRYSAIGFDTDLVWKYQDNKITVKSEHNNKDGEDKGKHPNASTTAPPIESLRHYIRKSKIDVVSDDLPPMTPSGLFGYMGYDMVRQVEDIPADNPDTLGLPDSVFMRPSIMIVFDNVKNMMCIITPVRMSKNSETKKEYEAACHRIEKAAKGLSAPVPADSIHFDTGKTETKEKKEEKEPAITSNMEPEYFHKMVEKAVDYINAGDIFQVVLSQRFSMDFELPAFELYRTLRRINPSPFLFYINLDEFEIVGSSPEILVRVRNGTMTLRPIAGTRKRGKTAEEDKALADDLLSDEKELAEHLMLLDLGRNDVGRVARIGSVNVTDEFIIENYSHVMHIVSNIEGKLKEDTDCIDALLAGFPAGTVSGAPKVRAMEIIEELEPVKRGLYGGCIGYIDGRGNMDTCIALRTAVVKDGKIHVQAGGGVVADSNPEYEFRESQNKAKAVLEAARQCLHSFT